MKELPVDERPRERLIRLGEEALSTPELIALLLDTGTSATPVLQLAAALLGQFQTLERLAEATLPELTALSGIGPAKALRLKSAFALAKRLKRTAAKTAIDSPAAAAHVLHPHLQQPVETLYVLLRDVQRKLLHLELVSKGTLTQIIAHPREILHIAIRHRAHTLIIAHNHPSGDPRPSTADLSLTEQLASACCTLGIPLVDHLIIAGGAWCSLAQQGLYHAHPY